ncbi:MAG: YbhB/YbcL family Raf kinase inhibitor-like protein [Rhodospirillales bacterium]|nr:YbhB/YbcL family Raf kinase inhibitor-like protein [Rhodospirillales bacterium]
MLENIPASLGHVLGGVRAGMLNIVFFDQRFEPVPEEITVTSPALQDGGRLPARFTQDGSGLSPPLALRGVPDRTASVVLIVEDADSPTPNPLVHAIVWNLPGSDQAMPEGALKSPRSPGVGLSLGKNSFLSLEYLPPDPPPGHGAHRYVFQVYALDERLDFDGAPGRGALLDAMAGHVLAKGCMIGTYERD